MQYQLMYLISDLCKGEEKRITCHPRIGFALPLEEPRIDLRQSKIKFQSIPPFNSTHTILQNILRNEQLTPSTNLKTSVPSLPCPKISWGKYVILPTTIFP